MPEQSTRNRLVDRLMRFAQVSTVATWLRKLSSNRFFSWVRHAYEPKWQRWALIVVTSLVAASMIAPQSFRFYNLTEGNLAPETIVSPIKFEVVDDAATTKNQNEIMKSVRPVYDFDDEMVNDVKAKIASAFNYMRQYLEAEAEFRARELDRSKDTTAAAEGKPPASKGFQRLDENVLRTRFETSMGATVSPSAFALLKSDGFNNRIERDLLSLVTPVLHKGVVLSRDLVLRDGKQGVLLLTKSTKKLEPLNDLTSVWDLKEAIAAINDETTEQAMDTALSRAVRRMGMDLINVNITHNRDKSEDLKKQAQASVKPVSFQVAKGERIIKKGDPVNAGHLSKLAALNRENPIYSRYIILLGLALMLALLLQLCFYFSEKYLDRGGHETEDLMLLCLLLVGTIVLVRVIFSFAPMVSKAGDSINPRSVLFVAPVATGSMLAALMINARIAFIFAALTSLTAVLAIEGDVYLFIFYFISGIVGLHGMTRITDRTSILRAGLMVGLVNMVSVLAIKMALGQLTKWEDVFEVGLGFLGGVLSGLLVSGLAPLLEPLGYTTNVKLLEIASLNHPVLKEMALQAPGTYHHSIVVGNLAEAAAESIGANPLLARVGALYHDIGKVGKKAKPSYFIENQNRGNNPHDKLEPSMSALILVAHVKHGVEKAREFRLGQPIIDVIEQHHGTGLIKFFYNKAMEKADKIHQPVSEDKYHYPGPRPRSKEAALVMLADVTEAACRTLAETTPAQIQKRIQTLIMGLFSDGQLDESTLTLKDLHAITRSFVRSMQGILHSRIEYPEETGGQEKTNGDNHRQPADKDRHKPRRIAEENGTNIRRLGL